LREGGLNKKTRIPNQLQIRARETETNPNVTPMLVLTLTLLTVLAQLIGLWSLVPIGREQLFTELY